MRRCWCWGGAVSGLPDGPGRSSIWLPWEFSWPEYLATALSLGWFVRGLRILPRAEHPPPWRSICFVVGVASF